MKILWRRRDAGTAGVTAFVAGALFGLAMLLRPEAGWFAVAVLVGARWLDPRPSGRMLGVAVAGAALAAAPLELHTILHFKSLIPPHLATNAGLLHDTSAAARTGIAKLWFGSTAAASIWRATPAIVIALLAPLIGPKRRGAPFLWVVAALDAALVLLTAPNDGGAQWGPRYLLFAYVPLAILAADGTPSPRRASWEGSADAPHKARRAGAALIATLVLITGAWSQRAAYRTLRGTKLTYGRVVDFMARESVDEGYVLTDLWWLDQVGAATVRGGRVLYVDSDNSAQAAVRLLDAARPDAITVVSSPESRNSVQLPPDSCFREVRRAELAVRQLVAVTYRCGDPSR